MATGFLLLLVSAYLDNLRGPLLPLMSTSLNISYGATSWMLIGGNIASILATYMLLPLTARLGNQRVALLLGLMGILCGAWALALSSFTRLLMFALVFGGMLATMGAMSNIMTLNGAPVLLRSRYLSGLHVMYGLGSLSAPIICSILLGLGWKWPWLFFVPLPLLIIIMVLNINKVNIPNAKAERIEQMPGRFSAHEVVVILQIGSYVLAEVLTSMWLVTYLVERQHFDISHASNYQAGFFFAMAFSRFAGFLFLKSESEKLISILALVVPMLCSIIGLAGLPLAFVGTGLVGPFFPISLARASRAHPFRWHALTIWVVITMQFLLAIAHGTMGLLVDQIGITKSFYLPILFFIITIGLCILNWRLEPNSR